MNFCNRQRGFTLIESLLVIAIVAIGAAVAVPSLSSFLNQTKLNSYKSMLANDMNMARSEAIKRNARVSVCAANSTATDCAGSSNWGVNGWLICPTLGAACDTTASAVAIRPAVSNGITLTATDVNPVIFRPIGTAVTAEQITLTGKPGTKAGTVSLAITGSVSAK